MTTLAKDPASSIRGAKCALRAINPVISSSWSRQSQRRHQAAGLIVTDVFRKIELWLVDEGLELSLPEGTAFATRYFPPECFSMTAGVGMPVDIALLTSAMESAPQLLRRSRAEAIEDRRFAEAVYRAAIADGIMNGVTYQDPGGTGDAA